MAHAAFTAAAQFFLEQGRPLPREIAPYAITARGQKVFTMGRNGSSRWREIRPMAHHGSRADTQGVSGFFPLREMKD